MIRARLEQDRQGEWRGFRVEGHAGFAGAGQDIVCAAVSMLAEASALALLGYLGEGVQVTQRSGKLVCRWGPVPPGVAGEVRGVLRTLEAGLMEAERHYPACVRVTRVKTGDGKEG